ASVPLPVPVAEFKCFKAALRGSRRNRESSKPGLCVEIDLDCGICSGIQDFPRDNLLNFELGACQFFLRSKPLPSLLLLVSRSVQVEAKQLLCLTRSVEYSRV